MEQVQCLFHGAFISCMSYPSLQFSLQDLDVAVVKATNHIESPPKEKHVRSKLLPCQLEITPCCCSILESPDPVIKVCWSMPKAHGLVFCKFYPNPRIL